MLFGLATSKVSWKKPILEGAQESLHSPTSGKNCRNTSHYKTGTALRVDDNMSSDVLFVSYNLQKGVSESLNKNVFVSDEILQQRDNVFAIHSIYHLFLYFYKIMKLVSSKVGHFSWYDFNSFQKFVLFSENLNDV